MAASRFKPLLCDCFGTNPVAVDAIATGTGEPVAPCSSSLCRQQVNRFTQALARDEPVLVGCTQEAPLFLELAEEAQFQQRIRFVNIREKAGWATAGKQAGPKMAALIAEAAMEIEGPGVIDIESAGSVLIVGNDDVALEAATKLASRTDATLLLTAIPAVSSPRLVTLPIFVAAPALRLRGHLGAFELSTENLRGLDPSARGNLAFEREGQNLALSADVILDLRHGEAPLVTAPAKRDGYLRADPRDPAAVAHAILAALDLNGEFEKPLYVRYEAKLCAHSRSGIVGCRRCLDVCPTGAITPEGDKVSIEPHICAGCGACAAACPTGAASYALPAIDGAIARVQTLVAAYTAAGGERPVLLVHDGHYGEDMIDTIARHYEGLPANVIPFAVNSVAQCGLDFLLGARASGASAVSVLAAPQEAEELVATADAVTLNNTILPALGYADGQAEILTEADPEEISRRIGELAQQPRGPAVTAFRPSAQKREVFSLALGALRAAAPSPVDEIPLVSGAPFGEVRVDTDSCTLCLACTGACPANALRASEDTPRLSFLERACVQCGICANTCPEKAISLRPRLDLTEAALRARTLKEEQPFHCVRCGKAFGTRSTIERIVTRMSGHSMFSDPKALDRLQMCADCRVADLAEAGGDPLGGPARPRVRTTEDYIQARERGEEDFGEDPIH